MDRYTLFFVITALILSTLISYRHVFRNGFVFDDGFYLVQNPQVQNGITPNSIKWAFTTDRGANWHPLTWLSTMLDYQIYGAKPAGHHATNLIFHIANTILLLLVLRRMTGSLWKSAFVAALFALHPLHVESAAWLSERKDVLSTFLMLVTIWAYVKYAERPSVRGYALVAFLFALGLMAKPMLVSLPLVLLLLDYWPLRRKQTLPRLAWEKSPLFVMSAISSVVTFMAQKSSGAVMQLDTYPVGLRIANSLVSYAAYIGKTFWPAKLTAYYPYPGAGIPAATILAALFVVAAISIMVIKLARSRPYLAAGWLWYIITLIPVIGLVQVGGQAMADRYTYIPLIGIFIMAAWGIPDLLSRHSHTPTLSHSHTITLAATSLALIAVFAVCTSRQVEYWRSDYTLFRRAAAMTNGNALVLSNYGLALAGRGESDQAIRQYKKAILAEPNYVNSYLNLGNAYRQKGRIPEALEQYREALRIKPDFSDASLAIALILAEQGHGDIAVAEYEKAIRENPNDANAYLTLGLLLEKQGRADEALSHFERAIEINPASDKAYYNAAALLRGRGDVDKAARYYEEALRINPNYAKAHAGLGTILGMQGRPVDAADHFRQAIKLEPGGADAHNDYGILLAQQGHVDEAIIQFADAVKYRPDYVEAHCNLGRGLAEKGDTDAAIAEFEKASELDPDYLDAHGNLAMAYYAAGRYADAWREVRIMERSGVKLPPDFITALSSKMPPK